jgi:heme exporter protein D
VNWKSAADFWAMGGYGFFVWGSYGIAVAIVAVEVWLLRKRRTCAVAEAARSASEMRGVR